MWRSSRFRRIAAAQETCKKKEEEEEEDEEDDEEREQEDEQENAKLVPDHRSCLPSSKIFARSNGVLSAFKSLCTSPFLPVLRASKRKCLSLHNRLACGIAFSQIVGTVRYPDQHLLPAVASSTALLLEEGKEYAYYQNRPFAETDIGEATIQGTHLGRALLSAYRRFTLQELKTATSNFSENNMLGQGSSGSVYRGRVASGLTIAVKALSCGVKDAELGFVTEVETMRHIRNRYILPLLGYCIEDGHLFLVYRYVRRGSLDRWLHGEGKYALSWGARCKVAIGLAKALEYLHSGCKRPVIHRDVKASNILLSNSNNPKLSDFGLALRASDSFMIGKDVIGTFGYLAPEYFHFGKVSAKMDVYSFGVVLLELMTGRQPIEREAPRGEENLVSWVQARHLICESSSCLEALADPKLKGSYCPCTMKSMLCTAALCVHPLDTKRPSIGEVLSLMDKDQAAKVNKLMLEAYDIPSSLSLDVGLSKDQEKRISIGEKDQVKRYLQMAMDDVEEDPKHEESSLLCGPCIV